MSSAGSSGLPRALCITRNNTLRRTLRRTLNAAGSQVEFSDRLTEQLTAEQATGAAIIVIDQDCRKDSDPQLIQVIGQGGKVIVIGDSLDDDEVLALLREYPMDHVISDPQATDERELLVTSVKLLSGDIFGIQKYLAWGVTVHETQVKSYDEKRAALLDIAHHAKEVGARRQVIAKIESVTDELLMNALYDAPIIRHGLGHRPGKRRPDPAQTSATTPEAAPEMMNDSGAALLRYACDGRYFAVSVQDDYGELHKEAILDHVRRARAERGRPSPEGSETGGAGLGLYFILSSVTRFIANIDPGKRTEVICLFDLRQSGREAKTGAQSLHIFRV